MLNLYVSNCSYLFGTARYVDYLTFSHLNLITNPTPLPNATLTIGATARNPNYQGSRVYPNYRGSLTQPWLSGLLHATLMVRAAGHGLVGAGGELGLCPRGLSCMLAAHAAHSRHILAACARSHFLFCTAKIYEFILYMNSYLYEFIFFKCKKCMNSYWIHHLYEFISCMNSYIPQDEK